MRGAEREPQEPSATTSEVGRVGDFVLLREVGRGGMGVVYEARQLSLERRVALKVLPFAAVLESQQIARFKNEAQAAAQLHHPNIVPVFAVGVERGVHYYAMQFIDGSRWIGRSPDCGARAGGRASGTPRHSPSEDAACETVAGPAATVPADGGIVSERQVGGASEITFAP